MREVAGAENTGREQRAQAKLRRIGVLDKAGLYQKLGCVRRANTTLSAHLSNLQVGAYWAESCQQVISRLAGALLEQFRRLQIYFWTSACSVLKKTVVTDMKTRSAATETDCEWTGDSCSGYVFLFLFWGASAILRIPEEAGY